MPEDEVKLPPIPGHMHLRAESPVALSSESITAMLHSYGKQCYEAGVATERERCARVCMTDPECQDPMYDVNELCAAAIRKGTP